MKLRTFAQILVEQGCFDAEEAAHYDSMSYGIALASYKLNCDVETVLNWDGELPDVIRKFWITNNNETQQKLLQQIRFALGYRFHFELQEVLDQYKGDDEQSDWVAQDNSERKRSHDDDVQKGYYG